MSTRSAIHSPPRSTETGMSSPTSRSARSLFQVAARQCGAPMGIPPWFDTVSGLDAESRWRQSRRELRLRARAVSAVSDSPGQRVSVEGELLAGEIAGVAGFKADEALT